MGMHCSDGSGIETEVNLKHQVFSGIRWSSASLIGTACVQLIQLWLLSKILTRYEFGLYAMVMSVVQIIRQFSDVGIGSANVQRQNPTTNELSSLYWTTVAIGL